MKLVRFNRYDERPNLARLGAVLDDDTVIDLRAAYARYLHEQGETLAYELSELRMPPNLISFLASGASAMGELQAVTAWCKDVLLRDRSESGVRGEQLFCSYSDCRLHAPVRPSKLILARIGPHGNTTIVTKPIGTVVGPTRNIIITPDKEATLRCSPGIAFVIGRACASASEETIAEHIAGYTLMTDVSLRESCEDFGEFTRSMFPSFAPCGPWLSLRHSLHAIEDQPIEGQLDGHLFARYRLSELCSARKVLAFLSRMTLDPGDTIWIGRQFDSDVAVRLGSIVVSKAAGLGILSNKVATEQPPN